MLKTDFNLGWQFWKEGQEQDRTQVRLPHDAMVHEARAADASNGAHAYFPGGVYVYEKHPSPGRLYPP